MSLGTGRVKGFVLLCLGLDQGLVFQSMMREGVMIR